MSPLCGPYSLKRWRHDAVAFGGVDEVGLEADQAARGDDRLRRRRVWRLVLHVRDVGFAARRATGGCRRGFRSARRRRAFRSGSRRLPSSSRLIDDFRAGDEDLEAFAAHLLDEDRDLHFAARLDFKVTGGVGVGRLRIETFVRVSRTRRSRTWRAVRSLPSRPASGPSLMQIFIVIVGGSISMKGSGRRSSVSVIVSPMKASSKPQMPTMSPALACLSLDLGQA